MWGPYYGMYIVTEKKRQDKERKEYYQNQKERLSNGEITRIIPFKENYIFFFK